VKVKGVKIITLHWHGWKHWNEINYQVDSETCNFQSWAGCDPAKATTDEEWILEVLVPRKKQITDILWEPWTRIIHRFTFQPDFSRTSDVVESTKSESIVHWSQVRVWVHRLSVKSKFGPSITKIEHSQSNKRQSVQVLYSQTTRKVSNLLN